MDRGKSFFAVWRKRGLKHAHTTLTILSLEALSSFLAPSWQGRERRERRRERLKKEEVEETVHASTPRLSERDTRPCSHPHNKKKSQGKENLLNTLRPVQAQEAYLTGTDFPASGSGTTSPSRASLSWRRNQHRRGSTPGEKGHRK